MPTEVSAKIVDTVSAELVECQPEPEVSTPLPTTPPDVSPTQQALQATIEQTGADPPPNGRREPVLPAFLLSSINPSVMAPLGAWVVLWL